MDDAELLLTLYDAKSGKSFSENFAIRWATNKMDQGWSQTDIFHNFRALFTVMFLKIELSNYFFRCPRILTIFIILLLNL